MTNSYKPSCMSVRYSTPHRNSIQAGFAGRQTFRSSNVIFLFVFVCVCQYSLIIKFLEWTYRKKGDMRVPEHEIPNLKLRIP